MTPVNVIFSVVLWAGRVSKHIRRGRLIPVHKHSPAQCENSSDEEIIPAVELPGLRRL